MLEAIRELDPTERPSKLYGCEVWRDLDWLLDEEKVQFDVAGHENLEMALLGVFDSQDVGGKRYDLASLGRRRAHATYAESHETDITESMIFAMDLTPLIEDDDLDPRAFVGSSRPPRGERGRGHGRDPALNRRAGNPPHTGKTTVRRTPSRGGDDGSSPRSLSPNLSPLSRPTGAGSCPDYAGGPTIVAGPLQDAPRLLLTSTPASSAPLRPQSVPWGHHR